MKGHQRLTPDERAHLQVIEQWSTDTRAAMKELRTHKLWEAIRKVAGAQVDQDAILDNVDWLVAAVKRLDRPTASDLIRSIEAHRQRTEAT